MKKYITTLLIIITTYASSYAQDKTTPIKSKWENSYNSTLNIEDYNEISRYFTGTYQSDTGASGVYRVIGFVGNSDDKDSGSTPITITLHWKPITGSKGTSDEKMTSTMTGQIYKNTNTNEFEMELFHNLSVPNAVSDVPELNTPGNYTETLIFTQKGAPSTDPVWNPSPIGYSEYTGVWDDLNNNNNPLITVVSVSSDDVVQATFQSADNKIHLLKGFIGDNNADAQSGNSLSLVGINSEDNTVLSFSGIINGISPHNLEFDGLYVEAEQTTFGNRYSAVKVEGAQMKGPMQMGGSDFIEINQQRIPLTNNGATEWTSSVQIGSQQGDKLKFGVDTGGNFNWANSAQCITNSCKEFNHVQFNQAESTTFEWLDKTESPAKWGPWGDGVANLGKDIIHFIPNQSTRNDLKLITQFPENEQFDDFLWDGGIALPSNTSLMSMGMSNFVARLLSTGELKVKDEFIVSFYSDTDSKTGKVQIGGGIDKSLIDESSKVILPFNAYPAVQYLWTTSLQSFDLDGKDFGSRLSYFGIDSGSSAMKGDSIAMASALSYAVQTKKATGKYPNMNLQMGTLEATGKTAKLVVTSDQYVPLIDQGDKAGQYVPQIQTLGGVDSLVIQGSTLMNSVYSVFVYETLINPNTLDVELSAKEMWLYNLIDGPKIIQTDTDGYFYDDMEQDPIQIKVYPNPLKQNLSINLESKNEEKIHIKVIDLTGRTIYKTTQNARVGTNTFHLKNVIKAGKKIAKQIVILDVKNSSGTINIMKKILIE